MQVHQRRGEHLRHRKKRMLGWKRWVSSDKIERKWTDVEVKGEKGGGATDRHRTAQLQRNRKKHVLQAESTQTKSEIRAQHTKKRRGGMMKRLLKKKGVVKKIVPTTGFGAAEDRSKYQDRPSSKKTYEKTTTSIQFPTQKNKRAATRGNHLMKH